VCKWAAWERFVNLEEESDNGKRPFEDERIDANREDDKWKMPIRNMLRDRFNRTVKRTF
jgi:hypothetical protein